MIYACPSCGGCLNPKKDQASSGNQSDSIKCPYCGNYFDFKSIHTSHIVNGYNYLAAGQYTHAYRSFDYALKLVKDEKGNTIHEYAYIDAYLGRALAQFDVQIVFEDAAGLDEDAPIIIVHTPNKALFQECEDFIKADELIDSISVPGHRARHKKRLLAYADYIDGIKLKYEELERKGLSYELFIAYEDMSKDRREAYHVAKDLAKCFPTDKIKRIFYPDPDESVDNMINYEAKILYALNHSRCMLVLVDGDMDNRLIEMYSQFDAIRREEKNRNKGIELGFVRYSGQFQIHLGNVKVANNIFRIEDQREFVRFVLNANGFDDGYRPSHDIATPVGGDTPEEVDVRVTESFPRLMDASHVSFGRYPQGRENSTVVMKYFYDRYGYPAAGADTAWKPLHMGKNGGAPYTWYIDDTVDGVDYRAVYVTDYRDVYAVNVNSPKAESQRRNSYLKRKLYVFKYEPVIWNILKGREEGRNTVLLVSSIGLDAHPFNEYAYGNFFEDATLATWLNESMKGLLFNEDELEWIRIRGGLKLRLLHGEYDLDTRDAVMKVRNYNIGFSDYFLCVGGSVMDRKVNAYWVESERRTEDDRAAVIFPSVDAEVRDMPVDCTTVAIVPTIQVRLPND